MWPCEEDDTERQLWRFCVSTLFYWWYVYVNAGLLWTPCMWCNVYRWLMHRLLSVSVATTAGDVISCLGHVFCTCCGVGLMTVYHTSRVFWVKNLFLYQHYTSTFLILYLQQIFSMSMFMYFIICLHLYIFLLHSDI